MDAAPTQVRRRATAVSPELGMGIAGVGGAARGVQGDAVAVCVRPSDGPAETEFFAGASMRRGDGGGGETRGFGVEGVEEDRGGWGGASSPA